MRIANEDRPASYYAMIMLRWGLAFAFFYAAISSLRGPEDWIPYLPSFLVAIFSDHSLLTVFSLYQIILAVWLFWGGRLAWASLTAAITLIVIVFFNLNMMERVFPDVGLALAALALFALARNENRVGGRGQS